MIPQSFNENIEPSLNLRHKLKAFRQTSVKNQVFTQNWIFNSMKKIILWAVAVIVLLIIAYFVGSKLYTQYKFKSDHDYVEKVILQKDSENRGYSDIVKEKINDNFTTDRSRMVVQNEAKTFREVIKSKNESEFVESSKKMLLATSCTSFVLYQENHKYKSKDLAQDLLSDTPEMYQYYQYLDLMRFSETSSEIIDFINSKGNRINTEKDFERLCLK